MSVHLVRTRYFRWRVIRTGARTAFASDAIVRHAVFPGTWIDLVRERMRLRYFPPLVKLVPELRRHLNGRWFLSKGTANYDLALASLVVAAWRGRSLPLLGSLPYAVSTYQYARLWGRRRTPLVCLALLASDTVGAAALAAGSVRARTVVL